MITFAAALLITASNAVGLQGIYEHDHYVVEPFTVTRPLTFRDEEFVEEPAGLATIRVVGERIVEESYSDESGFGSDSSSEVTTIVSFSSVSRHNHSDDYSETARGFKNSDYYSSQSGEAGGFYRDAHGDVQVYVDHSDDDFIGFKRDAYGRI